MQQTKIDGSHNVNQNRIFAQHQQPGELQPNQYQQGQQCQQYQQQNVLQQRPQFMQAGLYYPINEQKHQYQQYLQKNALHHETPYPQQWQPQVQQLNYPQKHLQHPPNFLQPRPQQTYDELQLEYQQYLQQNAVHYQQQQQSYYQQFQPQPEEYQLPYQQYQIQQESPQNPPGFLQSRPQPPVEDQHQQYKQYLQQHTLHHQQQQQPYYQELQRQSSVEQYQKFLQEQIARQHEYKPQAPKFMQQKNHPTPEDQTEQYQQYLQEHALHLQTQQYPQTQQQIEQQYQQYLQHIASQHHQQPLQTPQFLQNKPQQAETIPFDQIQPKVPKFMQKKPEIVEERSPSDQETDSFEVSDQSQIWRRSRTPSKIRSRSLQPRERSLENLPWLRGKRDHSVPKQDTFLQGKTKEPIRPWIEEVIKLKRTELQRKVIERPQLEKVDLKESHIEHHEIPKEQLEMVDLKCVQYPIDQSKFGRFPQQGAMGESELTIEDMTQEQREAIEVAKQIDTLIQKDSTKGVPWEIQKQQLKTIERAQKIIDKFKVEEVDSTDIRKQQEILRQKHLQRISNQEDITMLTREEQMAIEAGKIKSQISYGKPTQMAQKMQPCHETEDMLTVSEDAQLDMRKIDQHEQETSAMSQRGKKPKSSDKGVPPHTEDTTILSVKEREEILQRELKTGESPVGWRRGPKGRAGKMTHTEESEILQVEQTEGIPSIPHQKQTTKQPGKATVQHIEDSTILGVKRREEINQKIIETGEKPVLWKRGPKQKVGELSHTEESAILEVEQSDGISQPKIIQRGKSAKQTPSQHVEDVSVKEAPIGWKIGKKPQKTDKKTEQSTQLEVTEGGIQSAVLPKSEEKSVPWLRGKTKPQPQQQEEHPHEVKLKPATRKSIDQSKEPHEMTEVKLRSVPRQPKQEPPKPAENQPEEISPHTTDIVPSDATYSVTWTAEEIGPLNKTPKEKSIEEKAILPTDEPALIGPQEKEKVPWRCGDKKKPNEKLPEEKQWPTGKRKPKQSEDIDNVELKPIPRKKPLRKESEETPDKITPTKLPSVDRVESIDELALAEGTSELTSIEDIPEDIVESEEEISKRKVPKSVVKPPKFTKKLQPEVCKPDELCILQASIDGMPLPEVKWMFNDNELHATEHYEMNLVEKIATLKIARVTTKDVGIYTCEIRNEAGVATSRANIVIGKSTYICR